MCCDNQGKTLTKQQAISLYNTIDYQLLKEAKISDSDAKVIASNTDKPLDQLPSINSLDILDAVNEPSFAAMLAYTFIPDGSDLLKQNPKVKAKRDVQNKYIDQIVKKTNIDRSYIQKHLRNALVSGYGKTPEHFLHDVMNDKPLNGLGIIPLLIAAAPLITSTISKLFGGGTKEDTSTVGYQNFLATVDRGKIFPAKAEMLQASAGWEGHIKNAIASSYDPSTGTWSTPSDDWKGAVTSLTPITVNVFKGSGEKGTLTSSVNSNALQAAYVAQTGPASTDFSKAVSPQLNVTNDPAYVPPANVPFYKTTPGMIGIGFGALLLVGGTTYALTRK
jgi:hypothetical protein